MSELRFPEFLGLLIKKSNLTKSQLAERAGISRASLYNLINGDVAESKLSTLIRLSSALGVHPLDILQPYFKGAMRTCTGSSQKTGTSFIEDITYPDYSTVLPSQTFTKTWAVMNTGKTAWDGLFLTCQDFPLAIRDFSTGLTPTHRNVPIPFTAPGEKRLVSVNLTAPSLPGTVQSEWKTTRADGSLVFPDKVPLYCIVKVCSL
ncbi:NBR1-Ig-like domain-containing protein [Halomonas sp. LS-001]